MPAVSIFIVALTLAGCAGTTRAQPTPPSPSASADAAATVEPERFVDADEAEPDLPGMRAIVVTVHGNSSDNESTRRLNGRLVSDGYAHHYRAFFPPLRAMGFRRFAVWNPFGVNGGEEMDADQAVEMQQLLDDPDTHWRMRELLAPAAWTAAVTANVTGHGDELIAYNGALDQDPDFVNLRHDPDAWNQRAAASYQPFLDAHANIGVDAGSDIAEGSIEHAWLQHLRDQGVTVYVETYWPRHNTWVHDLPCIVRDDFYRNAIRDHPRGFTDAGWALRPDDVKAEVCRLVGFDANETLEQRRHRIRAIVADGHTPIISAQDAAWYAREVGW